jgi:hypothetical protein
MTVSFPYLAPFLGGLASFFQTIGECARLWNIGVAWPGGPNREWMRSDAQPASPKIKNKIFFRGLK